MSCFHCDHQRPPDEFTAAKTQFHQPGPRPRLDQPIGLSSQAWNFDFDDNESDGADVAAFEFADPPRTGRNPLDSLPQRGLDGAPPEDRSSGDRSSDAPRTGFDDFDDEDDDVDSYEIDDRPISRDMPKFGSSRGSADHGDYDDDDDDDLSLSQPRERSFTERRQERGRPPLGSDEEIQRNDLGRNARRRADERPRSYDSDDGFLSGSDSEDFGSSRSRMNEARGRGPSGPSGLDRSDSEMGRAIRGRRASFNRADDDDDDDDRRQGGARRGRNVGMRDGWRGERSDQRGFNGPSEGRLGYRNGGRGGQPAWGRSRGGGSADRGRAGRSDRWNGGGSRNQSEFDRGGRRSNQWADARRDFR